MNAIDCVLGGAIVLIGIAVLLLENKVNNHLDQKENCECK